MIWEAAIDLPPSVVYVLAILDHYSDDSPTMYDRCINLAKPTTSDYSRFRWAHQMGKEFYYASKAVDKTYGTPLQCRDDPLTPVRAEDLVVYRFKSNYIRHFSWDFRMDLEHNKEHMSRGVQNVGIVWEEKFTFGFRCNNPAHAWGPRICCRQLSLFLEHFHAVRNVFIQIPLNLRNTKLRSKKALNEMMANLTGKHPITPL